MASQFSKKVSEILAFSREEAVRLASASVGPEHLLMALLRQREGVIYDYMTDNFCDIKSIKTALEERVKNDDNSRPGNTFEVVLNEHASNILKLAVLEEECSRLQS